MKFTDGLWLMRDGVKASYGVSALGMQSHSKGLDFHVATKLIRHRGDTLGGPVLSVSMGAPAEGIITLKLSHFTGGDPPAPNFDLYPHGAPTSVIQVQESEGNASLTSGPMKAEVCTTPGSYGIEFLPTSGGSASLTSSGAKGQAVIDVPTRWTMGRASEASVMATDVSANATRSTSSSLRYMLVELKLAADELIYGTGESFGPVVKNGQSVSIWNSDGGTSSEQAYKCVPFFFSSRGYGVFVNHPGEVELEIGSEKRSRIGISVPGESIELYMIYGPSPKEVLQRYTLLTGRPSLPPAWTFGLWLSTSFLTDYDSKTVSSFLEGMRDRKCNVRVFHFDCFWMKQYEWCNFTFDPESFPNPGEYLQELKQRFGVKICVWINPYISQLSSVFAEAVEGGYLVKRKGGGVWQWNLWQPGMGIVDFSNPAACEWYRGKLRGLLDLGVDSFKTDFGERIPHAGVEFHDKSDPYRMHNAYTFLYNRVVFEVLVERFGVHEACVFARSATAGGQRFPVHWGGDCESTWEAMAESLRGGLSLTLSGFGFASHDIGGFEGHPPAEVYMRWCAYGAFSSHTRLHGSSSYRVPWVYDDERQIASKALAKFIDAKHRLMPYIYASAIEAHETGCPVQRAMILEFPQDRTTYHLDLQYMLGGSLLIAPVFASDTTETEYYLPAGRWTSFWEPGRQVDGLRWIKECVAYDDMPVWVRENSIICSSSKPRDRPDWDYTEDIVLAIYSLQEGVASEVVIPSGKGPEVAACVRVDRSGGKITFEVTFGQLTSWNIDLIGCGNTVGEVTGAVVGSAEDTGHIGNGVIHAKVTSGERKVVFELK